MLRLGRFMAAALLALAATGCITMSVASHVERGVDFSQFRTWEWGAPDALPTGDPRLDNNEFFNDRLQGAIEKSLAGRGFARVARGTMPDLLIHYHANINQRFQVNEPDPNCNGNCQASVIDYEQGTLVIDMLDAKTNKLVWRGWAQDSVQGIIDDQDRLNRQVDEAVSKMFALFPGKP
ncbi:MAG: DUF4136 domain-containing protein [Vicinamibacterales bacterium]